MNLFTTKRREGPRDPVWRILRKGVFKYWLVISKSDGGGEVMEYMSAGRDLETSSPAFLTSHLGGCGPERLTQGFTVVNQSHRPVLACFFPKIIPPC